MREIKNMMTAEDLLKGEKLNKYGRLDLTEYGYNIYSGLEESKTNFILISNHFKEDFDLYKNDIEQFTALGLTMKQLMLKYIKGHNTRKYHIYEKYYMSIVGEVFNNWEKENIKFFTDMMKFI